MTVLHADRLLPGVADWADELTAIRRDLHQNPELGFETERTVGKICEHLRAWGVDEIDTELVKGCVVAVVKVIKYNWIKKRTRDTAPAKEG